MSAFINKKIKEVKQIARLYYGPRYTRKQLSDRFHDWRRSSERDRKEKQQIIIDGSRSQVSEYSKNWKWVIIQAILWLIISFRFEFSPVINLMAFFTVFSQFSHSIFTTAKDKRVIFNNFICGEILSTKTLSHLIWETLSYAGNEDNIMGNTQKKNYAPECEWTDITIQLAANKHDPTLPFIKIIIGHESSELLHPSVLGLVHHYDKKLENSSFILLKLFGRHTSFTFDGHSSQRSSIEKKMQRLNDQLNSYFGVREMDPIVQNNVSGSWECFINIDDRTNTWGHKESERDRDITDLLSDWVPLDEEIEKVDKTAEAYKMKGYEW